MTRTPESANLGESAKPGYYAIIPAIVRYCPDLPANAKLLYGEITALCCEQGYCWATNGYFAKLYDVKDRAVQRWIAALEDAGFIIVEQDIDGYHRRLWLPEAERRARVKKDRGERQKRQGGMSLKTPPPVKKDTQSITETTPKTNTKIVARARARTSPSAVSEQTPVTPTSLLDPNSRFARDYARRKAARKEQPS